ncbi:hypothetical protein OIA45_48585 (plasmid) [Streptomyces chartreusis]|uniref:hypothetical protein n=1 Tax=Streptomyces chartreusis TaxID=1969 RepID=UPI0037DC2F83|nr:hypothetical protein OIA45_48585 [Streptomyces chartreusis]
MNKPNAQTTLKGLALTATLAAAARLGHQIATNTVHPATVAFTILAALLTGIALADDIRRGLRTIRRHLSRKPGPRFRCTHGDPKNWDDDEYEAYFAITADQPRRNIQPAA